MKKYTKHVTLLALTFLSLGEGAGYASTNPFAMGASPMVLMGPVSPSASMMVPPPGMPMMPPSGMPTIMDVSQKVSPVTPVAVDPNNPYCEFRKKTSQLRHKEEYTAMLCARTLHPCLTFAYGYWEFKVKNKQPEHPLSFAGMKYDIKLQKLEKAASGDKQACFADKVNFVNRFCVGAEASNYCKNDLIQMACSIVTKNPEAFVASGDHSDLNYQDILDNAAAFKANKKSPEAWAYLPQNATLLSNAQAWVQSKNAKLAAFGPLKAQVAACFRMPGFLKSGTKRKTAKDYMMDFGFKLDDRVGVKFTKNFGDSSLFNSTGTSTEVTDPDGTVHITSQSQGTIDTSWRF